MFDDLTDENYILYAAKNYDNHQCTGLKEFYDDLNYIKYTKRLFNRYLTTGVLKERLILNHLIFLYNNFRSEAMTRIIFLKMEEKYWSLLKPFLMQINYLPKVVYGINGRDINIDEISLDEKAINKLREI
jgi:hypothetical protein